MSNYPEPYLTEQKQAYNQNFIINNYIYLYDWCVFCLFLVKQLLTRKKNMKRRKLSK